MNTRTILVVEDDPNDENLTLRALRGFGAPLSVIVARSGRDALDFLLRRGDFGDRSSENPDVVFLDNTLPGVPGNELIGIIRSEESLKAIPLVVFSGSSDESVIKRCLDAGADEYLEKPLDMAEYLGTLRKATARWTE